MNNIPDKWRGKQAIFPQEIAEIVRLNALANKNGYSREELVTELKKKYFDLNDKDQRITNCISWGIIAANGKKETDWPNEGLKKKQMIITYDKHNNIIEGSNKNRIVRIEFDNKTNDVTKQIIAWTE